VASVDGGTTMEKLLRGLGLLALGSVAKSFLTGPDGLSYAPGRLMAFAAFGVSQWLLLSIAQHMHLDPRTTVGDWTSFLHAAAIFDGATAVTCVGLILGQAPTDAGGAFWKSRSTPSSAGDGTSEVSHP